MTEPSACSQFSDNHSIDELPEQVTKIIYLTLTCVKGVALILVFVSELMNSLFYFEGGKMMSSRP